MPLNLIVSFSRLGRSWKSTLVLGTHQKVMEFTKDGFRIRGRVHYCMSEFVYCACVNAVSVNTLNRLIQDLECVVQVCQCRSLLSQ